jgi:hypothetical protein
MNCPICGHEVKETEVLTLRQYKGAVMVDHLIHPHDARIKGGGLDTQDTQLYNGYYYSVWCRLEYKQATITGEEYK